MVTRRRDATPDNPLGGDTPNGNWINKHPKLQYGYDLNDIDRLVGIDDSSKYWFWHQYKLGNLLLLEEKRHKKFPSLAQVDTFGIVNQLLLNGASHPVIRWSNRRPSEITIFGYFVVRFECTCATDGHIMLGRFTPGNRLEKPADYIPIKREEYLRFLQFDIKFFEEKFHFHPERVTIDEQSLYVPQSKTKRRLRRRDLSTIPTLFNPDPTQQQALWEVEQKKEG